MNLSDPRFVDPNAAREWLEAQRWPNGPVCPHCGNADREKITGLKGKAHRPGLYQCAACRDQFTVTVGSVMERSKIPLNKWVLAMHLLGSSKKGMSAHQLHRMLGITYQSAWFLAHRIREAMRPGEGDAGPLGGEGGVVEADETYIGKTDELIPPASRKGRPYKTKRGTGSAGKRVVVGLVQRGGKVRTFHVSGATKDNVAGIVRENVAKESRLHTDESPIYREVGREFAAHERVHHAAKEYARGDVTTNSIEGYFGIFKRGMKGIYQHCAEKHLHRYLAEFDFRYNNRIALGVNDVMRAEVLAKGIEGKRLTYRRPHPALV